MDQEESWYVADRQLKHQETPETISMSSETELKAGNYTLAKQSDNVVKVNSGEFYLYRKAGATGVLTGMIGTGNDLAAARALGSIAGIKNIVRNLGNSSNTEEFTVQPNTPFETPPSIIPGDSYTVETKIMMADGTVKDGPVVEVTPKTERDDLGTISLTDTPYNFKVMGRIITGSAYSYIGQSYSLDIKVKNIGTEDSYGTTYEFPAQESGVTVTDDNINRRLGTIEPGIEKTISVSVRFEDTGTEDYADARVKVWIKDINNGVWEDSITLRFHRRSMTFNFASVDMPVYGVVLSPEKSGTYFKTAGGTGGLYATSLVMPYRSDGYVVSLSRATANTETVYSIGMDMAAAGRTAMDSFNDTAIFEPNNEETLATDMAIGTSIISYIHKNDVDFFTLRSEGVLAPVVFSPTPGTFTSPVEVSLTNAEAGAAIRYTTDGTTPTVSTGTLYSGPFTVAATQTIKAKAFKSYYADSAVSTGLYTITGTVATPSFNVASGTYVTTQNVAIATTTAGSSIRYSTNGTDPSSSSGTLYSGPVTISSSQTLKAIAYKTAWADSAVASAAYEITGSVATPQFSLSPGVYTTAQTLTLSSTTTGANIRYTTDGTTPTVSTGTLYSGPFSIAAIQTIKAIAYKTGWTDSGVSSAAYTITGTVATPSFSVTSGTYVTTQNVAIATTTAGSSIRYSTNGTDPSSSSGTLYSGPVTISSSQTLKAIAYKTAWADSAVASAAYEITGSVATPQFSLSPGVYTTAQTLTLSSATTGAAIRYTTDGTTPTSTFGTVYAEALTVSSTQTIKAIAYKTGCTDSGVVSTTYLIIVTNPSNYTSPNIGTLISVPAGTFQRNSTVTNTSTVSAFHMSEKEITRAQFISIMGTDPSDVTYSTGTTDPVQMVNWYHAIAFCNKLSIAEGLTPVYSVSGVTFATLSFESIPTSTNSTWDTASANWSVSGYRLPTEMEWMWAAMGATTGSTGYLKAFAGSTGSNAIGDYAWTSENSSSKTHPAGTKLPNELGLYDMSGNVWEWNWDWYGTYPIGALIDYQGPLFTDYARVALGGGWNDSASVATVAYRNFYYRSGQNYGIGFRVVRTP